MWNCRFLVFMCLAAAVAVAFDLNEPLEKDEIIEAVNSGESTWVAGRNFDKSFTKSYLKNLMGTKKRPSGSLLPELEDDDEEDLSLPSTFDARTKWSKCVALQTLRDQGPCGSCWAVAAASAFTDRFCIASKQKFNSYLSGENLLSCCSECAADPGNGCNGGYPDEAWIYFRDTGIVTGGDYDSAVGCQPYELPACEHHVNGSRKNCASYGDLAAPACNSTCYNPSYTTTYAKDLHTVKSAFTISKNVKKTQKEVYKHGPVEAAFTVYEDFLSYKSGVYVHKTGSEVGGHAVKIIGWGTESGTPYWLVANSWNSDWGDKGFFKIKRGDDECGFEEDISGGYPETGGHC